MKFLFVGYVLLIILCGVWAVFHANDVDENGYFKVQWRMILVFVMFLVSPLVAKLCGLV